MDTFLPQYAAHAIVDLRRVVKKIEREKHTQLYVYRDTVNLVIEFIRAGVHVVLPPNGEIYRSNDCAGERDTAPTADEVDSFYMPAPMTCFEYSWTHAPGDTPDVRAAKRITVVFDRRQLPDEEPFVTLFSIIFDEGMNSWMLLDSVLTVSAPLEVIRKKPWGYKGLFYELATRSAMSPGDPKIYKISGEWKADLHVVIQCCHALRAGATLREQTEQSSSRRRKFTKHGVGGFTYHMLTLPGHAVTSGRGSTGTHESPRFHVRRAHIRKLSTGALTFVRQCFVGDSDIGVVQKNYKMQATA